jgi:hypothetical protein
MHRRRFGSGASKLGAHIHKSIWERSPMKGLSPIGIMAVAALTVGCATEPPRPTEEMTRARTLIEQAEQNGAQRYAAADLQEARDKLQQSDQAASKGNTRDAQWLATEASADAQLAAARASSGKADDASRQVDQDLATLRSQTVQGTASLPSQNATPPPPPTAPSYSPSPQ